jgi:hypothetical protein
MSELDDLRARLETSRMALLEAVHGLTERDFSASLGEEDTVVDALAGLARSEREAVQTAREAAGAPPRPLPAGKAVTGRPLPPQVVHDLAGARYETELLLDWLAEADEAAAEAVRSAFDGIAAREIAVARQISGRERPGA